jgi:hypothetical protein
MQGWKVFEVENHAKLVVFELRDGKYWDGIPATRMKEGAILNGLYVCELKNDGAIKNVNNGRSIDGPYATAAEAESMTRKMGTDANRHLAALERAGLVRQRVGEDSVPIFQAVPMTQDRFSLALVVFIHDVVEYLRGLKEMHRELLYKWRQLQFANSNRQAPPQRLLAQQSRVHRPHPRLETNGRL